jgi:serine phosphatase RsbU (regulator of sigma subunit)
MEPAFLLITRSDSSTTDYSLTARRHTIGRSPNAEIVIDEWAVSRSHAMLEMGPSGRWWILDLGSRNGTFVNGARVTERLLSPADIVRIGDSTLMLRLPNVIEFPSPISVARAAERSGFETMNVGPDALLAMAASSQSQRIGAEHLASVLGLGRSLLHLEEMDARLTAFCEFVVGDTCPALGAAALRIAESGEVFPLCGPFARGSEKVKMEVDPSTIRELLDRHKPVMERAATAPGTVRRDTTTALIPFAVLDSSVDTLHAEFPSRYGTPEWLTLLTLVVEAYQQAELVWDMRNQVRQNALVEGELEMACQIQTGLVPRKFSAPGLELAFGFEPCRWVGGDYVDALMLPDGRVLLGIADVCGKGLQAALVASSVHTLMHASRELGNDLPQLMRRLNEYLLGYLPEHSFVTMLCILIDCLTGATELVSAGHPGAIVSRSGSRVEILSQSDNVGLGIISSDFVTLANQLDTGDVLLMYTDGLTEMVNLQDEPFGVDQLAMEFQRIVAANPTASVDSMQHRLSDLCTAYRGSRTANDDRTFLLATRRPQETMLPPT